MSEAAIYADLRDLMRDVFDDDAIEIGPETTAEDIPAWDSQSHIMLTVAAEQHFGIRFRTSELDSLHNVGEFVALIAKKQASP